jgi:hypothetical protein
MPVPTCVRRLCLRFSTKASPDTQFADPDVRPPWPPHGC